jgi:transcription-repair coupling factor (superfamily II helicase)
LEISGLISSYRLHPQLGELNALLAKGTTRIFIEGLKASSPALTAASFVSSAAGHNVFVLTDKEEAAYFYNDLCVLLGESNVLFFPSSYKRTIFENAPQKLEPTSIILRTEVLNAVALDKSKLTIVTYPEAMVEKVISQSKLESNTLILAKGNGYSTDFLVELLYEYEFKHVDFVYEPGQFAVRGSIIDIFSFSADLPYRIDFFGDTIESIRSFNIVTQLSKAMYDQIAIIPDIHSSLLHEKRIPFLEFIPNNSLIWLKDTAFIIDRMDQVYEHTISKREKLEEELSEKAEYLLSKEHLADGKETLKQLLNFTLVEFGQQNYFSNSKKIVFDVSLQPEFSKNFDILCENLAKRFEENYKVFILSESQKQIERLNAIFDSQKDKWYIEFTAIEGVLHEGFIDNEQKFCIYTDHQIFQRYHKFHLKTNSQESGKEVITIQELVSLQPGDYVVHVDHGVAKFGGLQKMEMNGRMQEVICLLYQDNDVLYVNIHNLHRISKFRGQESEAPKIHKLGSAVWQNLKNKAKGKVKDIARELIALYAKRKNEKGHEFAADTYMQDELESSFVYEDTPDQLKATIAVKKDMEAPIPMDRLVCGDVGFGKTEVAIRAAFKAVADSKQVAVLVPTTILALQHYRTFKERLKNFPCNVDYISRLKSAAKQKETLKKLEEGKVDILIGTHRIVSQDVKFKDLGLLIIDEEQKFGVSTKDKLKKLRVNVDTLTLTATPIPRTLQFSIMGARDLSVINTPPPNRYPIITELHTFNEELIKNAINYEIERNGQVFFINNRIQNIAEIEALINRICPNVRTIVAHGQMEGPRLEQIMLDFVNEEYGVLIATSIIESGLDIPNANTIIINNAQNFGLSDLHQLRGRVGRSNKKAFCYLLSPPPTVLSQEARRRLKAINDFSELGSGLQIAMQDLDIRGAGNLLGGEQSGFINDIGMDTYQKILAEALMELKQEEYAQRFLTEEETDTEEEKAPETFEFVSDCQFESDLELMFPDSFISNVAERIRLYRELDSIADEEKLADFERNVTDRFGQLPQQSIELLNVVRLRWLAMKLGIEKIVLKKNKLICHFVSNSASPFYSSPVFMAVIHFASQNPRICNAKQTHDRFSLIFDNIEKVSQAIRFLSKIRP